MHIFCTYFNHSYLPIGLTLIDSIIQHCKSFRLYILCLDINCYKYLKDFNDKNIFIISLDELESWNSKLLLVKENRREIEYYWTCTPCIISYILFNFKEKEVTYLDADQYFFNSPESVFEEIKNSSVAIMPHRFPKHLKKLEIYGKYNVSWLTFKNNKDSKECLKWWLEECINWCFGNIEDGKYGDQKYLDTFQKKFNNIYIIQNKKCGMAPWNAHDYLKEEILILYHFQSLRIINNYIYKVQHRIFQFMLKRDTLYKIYLPYLKNIKRNRSKLKLENQLSNTSNESFCLRDFLIGEYILFIFGKIFFIDLFPILYPYISRLDRVNRKILNVLK